MYYLNPYNLLITAVAVLSISFTANAQCSFSGLEEFYCEGDEHASLVGDPTGGTFSGPGIIGNEFHPGIAGPGTHTITYELVEAVDKYYIRAIGGEPWGGTPNPDAMDLAFGPGEWIQEEFETADAASIFVGSTALVYMDGSSMQASELEDFLIANLTLIEDWVFAGGRLLLNSAPNEDGDMDFGFGGTTLLYAPVGGGTHVNDVNVLDPAHPAQTGPAVPTNPIMNGPYYSHALIDGVGYTDVITEIGDPTKIILAEKTWGSGHVMVGGMTTANFHTPAPDGENWRSNLLVYLFNLGVVAEPCIVTQEVTVIALPDVTLTVDKEAICIGEEVIFTSSGADDYTFDVADVSSGVAYTPPTAGIVTYTVTGILTPEGCENTASVTVEVFDLPEVTASTDDAEVCFGDEMTLTGGGAATYVWDMGVVDGVAFTPGPIGTITYNVVGTSADGCDNTADITIEVIDCEPVMAGFAMDNNICIGDCITLTDESIGTTINSWVWDFGGGVEPNVSEEQNPEVCFITAGSYEISLTITSLYGQVSTATQTIVVNELPIITAELDTIITLGGSANLVAATASTGTFVWEPGNSVACDTCGITTASPIDSTMYNVYFTDVNGCKTQDQVMVLVNFVKGIGLPTAFSPNGDGENDVLYVKGIGLASVNLTIYNRYGEVVFETSDQNIGWDGTFKNKEENPGVFTWVLYYDFYTGDKGFQKGNVTLIR